MTFGLTDGTTNLGFQIVGYTPSYNVNPAQGRASMYGTSIGTTTTFSEYGNSRTLGVTVDASKSGVESEIDLNIRYIIKY